MRAVVVREFGPPSVMAVEDVRRPSPGPGEVLIRVHAVSVNRTLDCRARAGLYTRPVPLPYTPGADPSGVVAQVGPGVTGLGVGDRVTAKVNVGGDVLPGESPRIGGGYAEYALAQARLTTPIPDGLDFATATVVGRHTPPALTLLRDRAAVRPGEWVLVMGASGGLGSAGVQVARHLGARVIAAAGADERVQIGLALGAEAGVNYRAGDLGAEVRRITGGAGADVVFENIGEPALFSAALAAMARDGRLVTVGTHAGGLVPLDLTRLYQQALTITGTTRVAPADVAASLALAADGHVVPLIDRVLPLAAAVQAHERVEAHQDLGKIVLVPTDG